MALFDGKRILITGGTGSLGQALLRRITTGELGRPKKIIILSRDEAKQHAMKTELAHRRSATDDVFYGNLAEFVDFRIGDLKDYSSLRPSMQDADIVLNTAALKQVPVCEYFPMEAVKTNILGVDNLVRCIKENALPIELFVSVSTDKACKPINTYGMTKAIQERIVLEANYSCRPTKFLCVRYGNVMASRGSVIPLFQAQIRNGGPVTITTQEMTRFMMSLDTAVDTIFAALKMSVPGTTLVPVVPSARTLDVAEVMIGGRKMDIQYIGVRPGEKIHEILVSDEETHRTTREGDYFMIHSILPEVRTKQLGPPALTKELSSEDYVLGKDALRELLKQEKHLDF